VASTSLATGLTLTPMTTSKKSSGTRSHDAPNAVALSKFMSKGWAPTPLEGVQQAPVVPFCESRRATLSQQYQGVRLVIPAGSFKVRSNDTDFRFRPHSAFAYLTGISAADAVPDSVLVLDPKKGGHEALLFIHPRSPRTDEEFYRNARHGEFWIGRRLTVDEAELRYGVKVKHIDTLEKFLSNKKRERETILVRGEDSLVDKLVRLRKKKEAALLTYLSEMRLIKDSYEIAEMQNAVDASIRGFADMVKVFPAASNHQRGERIIESAFFGRARLEGNDLGYDTIVASGSHACILHWIKNDGAVKNGDLILIDAGAEMDSFYTADITRTLPVNGKFSPAQREIYQLVLDAQRAGIAVCKPGAKFADINRASHEVLARGLYKLGVLPVTPEESMKPEVGLHRRWTVHGVSHMLGIDVHDCAHARTEQYRDAVLHEGMILTVEPGLYIHPDDELFPAQYRGIGVRIEDDVLITAGEPVVMSKGLPTSVDEIEAWMAPLLR